MLYNRCLQSVISRLELLSRPALHSLNVNYLVLPISGPGFVFHGRLLGKFINPAVCLMKLLAVGPLSWAVFSSRPPGSRTKRRWDVGLTRSADLGLAPPPLAKVMACSSSNSSNPISFR